MAIRKKTHEKEGGPRGWLVPVIEAAYTRLAPKKDAAPPKKGRRSKSKPESRLQPGLDFEDVVADVPRDVWVRRMQEFQQAKAAASKLTNDRRAAPVAGQNNWVPLGPACVARGQAVGRPPVGGRTSGLAIALAGGITIYAATANGGVFRTDDSGLSWRSLMDGFDTDPTSFASVSLCCGAIAIDPANVNRVYVGTGEGDVDLLFTLRLTSALPAYRGIGPIRSDDGGTTWISETSTPSLAGYAFYQLAVDPGNGDHVIAATTNGLYQRVGTSWVQRRTGAHTSVVAARVAPTTTFYAAERDGAVYSSTDGITWNVAGSGFPATAARIALGVQSDNPNVLYALVSNASGGLLGVYRLDGGGGTWKTVSGAPALLNGNQGDYDLCIAIDPNNANLIYLGGDYAGVLPYPGNIQRCAVTPLGLNYTMAAASIGTHAHADVHVLAMPPGNSSFLWAGTDGGVFVNLNPATNNAFAARNTGLSSLCTDFIGMSETEPAVMYVGLQDNGTARYLGEELWRHSQEGDGGYAVVHPTDPFTALTFMNGTVYRTTTGGQDWTDWTWSTATGWQLMTEPIVRAPGNSLRVAFASGPSADISDNFGLTWPNDIAHHFNIPVPSAGIYAMTFASNTRAYVGFTNGRVYRVEDLGAGGWASWRLDDAIGGPLPLAGLITDIAVDPTDTTGNSIYITFGGQGDQRHVWHFDGVQWQSRSTGLIDVEHNALVVDPLAPSTLYVGADIGVWQSTDGGLTWALMQNGLPDAPVFDLQLHQGMRLLRASLHGRGVYEYRLDPPILDGTQLYIRDTALDTARGEVTDGRNDVGHWPQVQVWHWASPNIKVDVPTPAGYQTPTNQIDFLDFHERIVDGSLGIGTIDPPLVVHNRVYVLAHNRGPLIDPQVRVTAAITNASTVLSPLPSGFTADIASGNPLSAPWTTLGFVTLTDLRPGFPQVAAFDLPSTILPLPASLPGQSHFCLLAFLHSASDPFTNTQPNPGWLTVSEPKVAQKNLQIVQFIGVPPPKHKSTGMWVRLEISGALFSAAGKIDLEFDASHFDGTIGIVAPDALLSDAAIKRHRDRFANRGGSAVRKWIGKHSRDAERLFYEGAYRREELDILLRAMKLVASRPLIEPKKGGISNTLSALPIRPNDRHSVFMRIDPPKGASVGDSWRFTMIQRESATGRVQGGSDYSVRINKPWTR
jgi:photosystem II stability/assembly factor-like uncharacterized protein